MNHTGTSEIANLHPSLPYGSAYFARLAGLALLYALLAKIVLTYFSANGIITVVWPPSGLALAALLLGGKKFWPGIFIGAFLANLLAGSPAQVSIFIALGNTLEPLLGAFLLTRNGDFDPTFNRLHDYFRLIFLGGIISTCVSALTGTLTLLNSGLLTQQTFALNLLHWWMGDALGIMLVTPLILVWRQTPQGWFSRKNVAEIAALFSISFLFGQAIFLDWFHDYVGLLTRGYWMFLWITWAAVRFGRHAVLLILCMTLVQALLGASQGVGLFGTDMAQTQLANLCVWIAALSIVGMAQAMSVTERQIKENELYRINRTLAAISACDAALLRAVDETALFNEICRIMVNIGGYRFAWVGIAESTDEKIVRPIANFGFQNEYLAQVKISWADEQFGHGPTGTAIRTGTLQVNNNFTTNSNMAIWQDAAKKRGFASSIALPIKIGSDIGAITIYAAQPDAFNAEEITLLNKLVDELNFGIANLRAHREGKAAEARVEYLAYHDPLTELPNRLMANDRMELAIAYADRAGSKAALMFLDLDNFKTINDSLGHAIGDGLLKAVATRLRECVRDTDTICRQGGDEFLIILPDVPDSDAITGIMEKIQERLAGSFIIDNHSLSTSFSIGVAVYPDDGNNFDSLLKKADTAMYHAKEAGRNTYRFHTEQMNVDAVEHLSIRNGLRRALEHNEFVLYYQPQINLSNGVTFGAEALIRWNHPELGLIPPVRFISVAEESGLIVPIGEWVLHEACRQAVAWREAGLPELVIAVNLSAVQFKRGDLEKSVIRALAETGLDPICLELELTESILIQDTDKVLEKVMRLKSLGVKLSIDDFGTGYSSLSYLKRFNVDKLKIDQSFVRDLTSNPEDQAIVHAIIQMAHSLNMNTIAEGVEDENVLDHLRIYHCDEAQGYHFARPMPADEFSRYLLGS